VMSSKHIGADMNYAYPTAEIAVMGPEGAINILYRDKLNPEEKQQQLKNTAKNLPTLSKLLHWAISTKSSTRKIRGKKLLLPSK